MQVWPLAKQFSGTHTGLAAGAAASGVAPNCRQVHGGATGKKGRLRWANNCADEDVDIDADVVIEGVW